MAKQITLPKPYSVPSNWCWTDIGKIVSMKTGFPFDSNKFSRESDGRWPLIRIRDVLKGETETFTDEPCPEQYVIHAGEILIGMDGDFNVAKWKGKDALLNQRVCSIESCSKLLLNDYLYFYLPDILKKINDATPSVTVKHLSTKTLEKAPIPIPPLTEQHRIVDRIERLFFQLDEAKEKAQAVVDGFEARRTAILHKAFTGELIGKHNTNMVALTVIADDICIGPFGSALHKDDYVAGGTPVINPKHIIGQQIYPEETTAITSAKAKELARYKLKENDIILGRRGDMGRSAPIGKREEGWICGTGSMIIRLKPEYLASFYSLYIASYSSVQYLEENCVGSTLKNLNEKIVSNMPVPQYSLPAQQEIVHILDTLLAKEQHAKEAAEAVLDQIEAMKKTILARAFRGELGTNDPAEESAVELLKQACCC